MSAPSVLDRWNPHAWVAQAEHSARGRWEREARPNQLAPPGDWHTWLILAGRGWGKTRSAAEWCATKARRYPGCRIALVAATFTDGVRTMVEGESGLLAVLDDAELKGGNRDKAWNRSSGELTLANGSQFFVYYSEKPSRLRGPQHHFAWGDEAAQWADAHKGTARDTTWSNLLLGLRLKAEPGWPDGYRPQVVVVTTPRPVALLKVPAGLVEREPHRAGITQRPNTQVTRGRTSDNLANLDETFREAVVDPLTGTTLGRQELEGEILEESEAAFLARGDIDRARVLPGEAFQKVVRTIVSIDPATTDHATSDETGIVVLGHGYNGDVYVLGDYSLRAKPDEWGERVWDAVYTHRAEGVLIEDNQGGDMVLTVLRTTWETYVRNRRSTAALAWREPGVHPSETTRRAPMVPVIGAMPAVLRVHPSGPGSGKWIRAQAVQPYYQQGRVHHVIDAKSPGHLQELEDQATTWTGDKREKSPDRVDALVHGITFLIRPDQRSNDQGYVFSTHARWAGMRGR